MWPQLPQRSNLCLEISGSIAAVGFIHATSGSTGPSMLGLVHLAGWTAAWRCAHGCPRCLGFLTGCSASPGVCVPASSHAVLASTDTSTMLKPHLHLLSKHWVFKLRRRVLQWAEVINFKRCQVKFLLVVTHHNFGFSQMAKAGYETTSKTEPQAWSCCLPRASRDGWVS